AIRSGDPGSGGGGRKLLWRGNPSISGLATATLRYKSNGVFVTSSDGLVVGLDTSADPQVFGLPMWAPVDVKRQDGTGATICARAAITARPVVQVFNRSDSTFQAAANDDLVYVPTRYSSSCANGDSSNRVYAIHASSGTVAWVFNQGGGNQMSFAQEA